VYFILPFSVGIFASQLAQVVRSSLLASGSQAFAPDLRQLRVTADFAITNPPYETWDSSAFRAEST